MKRKRMMQIALLVLALLIAGYFLKLIPFSFIEYPTSINPAYGYSFVTSYDPKSIATMLGDSTFTSAKCSSFRGIIEAGWAYSPDGYVTTKYTASVDPQYATPLYAYQAPGNPLTYCRLRSSINFGDSLKYESGKTVYFNIRLCPVAGCGGGKYVNSGFSGAVYVIPSVTTTTRQLSQTTTTTPAYYTTTTQEEIVINPPMVTTTTGYPITTTTNQGGTYQPPVRSCKNSLGFLCDDLDDTMLAIIGMVLAALIVLIGFYVRR